MSEKVTVSLTRHNNQIVALHLLSPRTHGPDVCIDLTPDQAESLANVILLKLGREKEKAE